MSARDYYAEAESIVRGEWSREIEPVHLAELIARISEAEREARLNLRSAEHFAGRAVDAEAAERRLLTALGALSSTLDAIADEKSLPADRCRFAKNAGKALRAFLDVERETRETVARAAGGER
ncbi:MAG: hypothetical protein ACQGVC_18090 [Myxococcota bacterium]